MFRCCAAVAALALCTLTSVTDARADDLTLPNPWSAGLDIGGGRLNKQPFENAGRTPLYLGFHLHYGLNSHWRVGLQLSGDLLEPGDYNDPSKGAGITQVLATLEAHPFADPRAWIEAGAGTVNYWSNAATDTNDSGSVWQLQAGHALYWRKHLRAGPFVGLSRGDGGRLSHAAGFLGVRIEWQQ